MTLLLVDSLRMEIRESLTGCDNSCSLPGRSAAGGRLGGGRVQPGVRLAQRREAQERAPEAFQTLEGEIQDPLPPIGRNGPDPAMQQPPQEPGLCQLPMASPFVPR